MKHIGGVRNHREPRRNGQTGCYRVPVHLLSRCLWRTRLLSAREVARCGMARGIVRDCMHEQNTWTVVQLCAWCVRADADDRASCYAEIVLIKDAVTVFGILAAFRRKLLRKFRWERRVDLRIDLFHWIVSVLILETRFKILDFKLTTISIVIYNYRDSLNVIQKNSFLEC